MYFTTQIRINLTKKRTYEGEGVWSKRTLSITKKTWNAFWWSPQGFECIFKQITHLGISIMLKSQGRAIERRMHCIYQNLD